MPDDATPAGSCQPLDPELIRRLLRARDRMAAAPHEAWTVDELARVSGCSEAHFARSFRQAFGVPPHRYLLTLRLERAKALLAGTERPILEVALESGWSSLGSFGRTFRDVLGESPGTYRRRARCDGRRDDLDPVPACIARAANRPDLRIAVRRSGGRTPTSSLPSSAGHRLSAFDERDSMRR